jgi:hypothetical protein
MSTRIVWLPRIAWLVLPAVVIAGCSESPHVLAPDGAAAVVAADQASIAANDGRMSEDGERDGDGGLHARPISGPTTITSPGHYRLTEDFEAPQGDGIVITASHVRLWLGEHRISGPGNKVGRAIVIDGARDVQVTGGRIERFGIGAALINASRCRLRDLEIAGGDEIADPAAGNPPQIGILLVNSAMNAISNNELTRLNLGIFVRGSGSYRNRISGNRAMGGDHGLLAICYNPAPGGDPAGPRGDYVTDNLLARFGTGISASAQSAGNVFSRNTIRYFTLAYEDLNGTNVFANNRTEQIAP